MASIPFDTLKSTILTNSRVDGVCEGYWEVMRATDYQSLIDAGIPQLVYAYTSGYLTDALLAEVDEALLNANGIYTTNQTVDNSGYEIFVFGAAEVVVNIRNGQRNNVNVLGNAIAHINISLNSWCKVKLYQFGACDVTVNDTSVVCMDMMQNAVGIAILNDDASGDISASGDSVLTVTANNTSYALVQGFGESQITTTGAGINQRLYELSRNPIST